jgi:hypothetical protein
MTIDYIVASLPALVFDQPPAISWAKFASLCVDAGREIDELTGGKWADLEAQLKNAVAIARGGAKWVRDAEGCSVYWRTRVVHAFQEKDVAKREELLDKIWWDAAEELTDLTSPLGAGALATYAVRLKIAIKRAKISAEAGSAAFDRLTAETKISF